MSEIPTLSAAVLDSLQQIVGTDKVRQDDEALATFGTDWTKVYQPQPSAIVFPKTIEQVQSHR